MYWQISVNHSNFGAKFLERKKNKGFISDLPLKRGDLLQNNFTLKHKMFICKGMLKNF